MAASMAGRSTILRTLCRASANSLPRRTTFSVPRRTSNLTGSPISHNLPLRSLRRELSSFQPLHTAIASAYLVSKLPSEASTFSRGSMEATVAGGMGSVTCYEFGEDA